MAKQKMKTHKASVGRFKVTSKGRVKRGGSGMSHLMSTKSATRRRRLGKSSMIGVKKVEQNLRRMLCK
jgi:large subunit ribosomal protein L35